MQKLVQQIEYVKTMKIKHKHDIINQVFDHTYNLKFNIILRLNIEFDI